MSMSKRKMGMYDDLQNLAGYGDDTELGQALKRMVEGPDTRCAATKFVDSPVWEGTVRCEKQSAHEGSHQAYYKDGEPGNRMILSMRWKSD
jgi:hypothetical protein